MQAPRILIVEDELVVAEDLRMQLQRNGYEVLQIAGSAEEAIEITKRENPNLVLMDVFIRGQFDGFETARIIQDQFSVPVIFITAASQSTLTGVKNFHPCGYLMKPFTEEELKDCVENALNYFAPR